MIDDKIDPVYEFEKDGEVNYDHDQIPSLDTGKGKFIPSYLIFFMDIF